MLEIAVGILAVIFICEVAFIAANIKNVTGYVPPKRGDEPIKKIEDGEPLHKDTSLADKVDGRITNIFKNPWEDIL